LRVFIGLGCVATLSVTQACNRDEPPPPLPPPASTPAAPAPPLEPDPDPALQVDAGTEPARGPSAPRSSLQKCCDALRQNAPNLPPANQVAALSAAGTCDGLVAMGKDEASVVSAVQRAVGGAGVPAACR
jgi:hypothetical protein